ncbi:MAG: hypothetical protein WCV92_00535 [Candidatus Buchananbacteria bacterium]
MKRFFSLFFILIIFGLGLFFTNSIFAAMTSNDGYQIWADVISVGGTDDSISPSGFSLGDSIGESLTGISNSSMAIYGGFREMEIGVISLEITPASLDLGQLSKDSAKSTSATLKFFSNLPEGKVYYTGTTLAMGGNRVNGIGPVATASTVGAGQFGFNAIYQSGDSNGQSLSPYNNPTLYAFNSGDDVVKAVNAMGTTTSFTLNYIANISGQETQGNYATDIVFTALGGF